MEHSGAKPHRHRRPYPAVPHLVNTHRIVASATGRAPVRDPRTTRNARHARITGRAPVRDPRTTGNARPARPPRADTPTTDSPHRNEMNAMRTRARIADGLCPHCG